MIATDRERRSSGQIDRNRIAIKTAGRTLLTLRSSGGALTLNALPAPPPFTMQFATAGAADARGRVQLTMTNRAVSRCTWASGDPLMQAYHDEEWGVPQRDARALWEMLMLEGFQAGLSWAIVLRKREAFRKAFAGFDPDAVARFTPRAVDRLLTNRGIIRARAKIEATITGARIFREMRDRGEDFAAFCWSFTDGHPFVSSGRSFPAQTPLSERLSKDLKRRGFKFVGPTIVYAWMQAVGIVNDHSLHCFRRDQVAREDPVRRRARQQS